MPVHPFSRPVTLRGHLTKLICASFGPLLIFVSILIILFARNEEQTLQHGLQETARALSVAVEKEFDSSITALNALASSEALDSGAVSDFRRAAWRVLRGQENWAALTLYDRFGNLVFENSARGPSTAPVEPGAVQRVLSRPEVLVGDFSGSLDGRVHVLTPVQRENKLIYILSAAIERRSFADILGRQKIPPDWIGSILDRTNTVVARTLAPDQTVGKPAVGMLQLPNRGTAEQVVTGETQEGVRAVAAVASSPRTGWSVALTVPMSRVSVPFWRSLAYTVGAGIISLLAGIWLASLFARRLAEPVAELSASTKALGEGRLEPPPEPLAIVELQAVAQNLQRAAELLSQRGLERDRVEAELRDRDEFLQEQARRLGESEDKLRSQAVELEHQLLASGRLVAVGELTASMAHEFNNPLGIILGFGQALLTEIDAADPAYHHAEIIVEEAQRCEKLVQELLEFGRPQRAEFASTEVAPIIDRTLALISNRAANNKVRVDADIPAELPPIHADGRQLQQVLVNLCFNAIDAMPRGGTLIVSAVDEQSGGVSISVKDTGLGIEPEMISKIFQPFVTANKRRGLGLGLPICDRIVKAHGGSIQVASLPGVGSTFTVQLPKIIDNGQVDNGEPNLPSST